MKLKKMLAVALLAMSAMGFQIVNAQSLSPSSKWHWDKGTIVINTPERTAGQEHVLGLTAAPIKTCLLYTSLTEEDDFNLGLTSTIKESYDYILKDLDDAIAGLPTE